jgi:thiopeptide-type bacteriocin biosynthesis protein
MILAESLFCADSEAVVDILDTPLALDLDARWRLTLYGMDRLLDDLGLDLRAKSALLTSLRASSRREHAVQAHSIRALGLKYRAERERLRWIFDLTQLDEERLQGGVLSLSRRSARTKALGSDLKHLARHHELSQTISELCKSYLHMHANRMFRRDARRQELVIYDLLSRLYDSRLARSA